MSFFINRDEVLDANTVGQIINDFRVRELPRLEKYHNYYLGKQEILRRVVNDESKPNHKIVSNYCYEIVNTYQGFLTGTDITYTSAEDIEAIQNILNYNDVSTEDALFLKNALIYGIAYEVMWIDQDGKQRFKVLDSRQCIPVYYNSLEEELAGVIRFYSTSSVDILNPEFFIDVYTDKEIRSYKADGSFAALQILDYIPNYYQQVPINIFKLNEEVESVFDKVITLQDSYNALLSDEVNDFDAFVDCYLKLQGIDDIDPEQLKLMRTNRVLVLPEGGTADFLYKNISDTQIENMLDNIRDTIREISACPDFSSDAFGTSSGIALRYKLIGFNNRTSAIEKNMTMALQRRIELICSILSLTNGEELWRDVEIVFNENLPIDYTSITSMITQLRGLVSDKTLISLLPFIHNVDEEMELVSAQKEANAALYNFTSVGEDDE